MNDLRHDPDTLDPVAERVKFMRQWQQVPDGVSSWGRTTMHHDGATWTNVDPPAPEAPDLRTVGDKVAELTARVEHLERHVHRLLNPGEQEGGE